MDKPTYEELEKELLELKKLQLIENRFSSILQASDDMITIHKHSGEYLYYNGPSCYAVSPKDVVGQMPSDIFDQDATKKLLTAFDNVMKTGKSETMEVLLDWMGEKRWFSEYIYPVKNTEGEVLEMVKVCRDIHERKIAEEKIIAQNKELLIAKEKAEESERLKTAFLANMSHEIRTPMNGLLGFSQLLKKKTISDEEREEYLDLIDQEGKRLLNIISDIVDISKIDSNNVSIDIAPCNVNSLIDELYSKYSISTMDQNITLNINKGLGDNDSVIMTDSNRLVQILSNLIENALKFTREGIVEIGYSLSFNHLQFYVKDSGPGIKTEDQQLIFGRFNQSKQHQVHDSGSGLGLSIAKGLTELLKGEIKVESKIGKGATFFVSIPYEQAVIETKQRIELKDESIDRSHFTILIAEDEEMSFMYLEQCLSEFNCSILHAHDGKEAIEIFERDSSIDFIMLDINMPIMNGNEVLTYIRKVNKSIPIIAQTALAMSVEKEKILAAGFNDYVSKPTSREDLISIINKYLSKDDSSLH